MTGSRRQNTRPNRKPSMTRKVGNLGPPLKRILIVCEGTKTEPNYFKSFRITSAKVVVSGSGLVTRSLVQHAIELRNAEQDFPYDVVWCVFDKDDFTCDTGIMTSLGSKTPGAYSRTSEVSSGRKARKFTISSGICGLSP